MSNEAIDEASKAAVKDFLGKFKAAHDAKDQKLTPEGLAAKKTAQGAEQAQ